MFYKSIAKVHRKWAKLGIYKIAHDEILTKNPILHTMNVAQRNEWGVKDRCIDL